MAVGVGVARLIPLAASGFRADPARDRYDPDMGRTNLLPARCSEAEFLALPETMDRVEWLDGEVYVSPAPSLWHQTLVLRLATLLKPWADAHPPAFAGLSPCDVRIAPGKIVQPDVFLLPAGPPRERGPITVVPPLVVEVLSADRGHDLVRKRAIYEAAGVVEYWMVDPDGRLEVAAGGVSVAYPARFVSTVAPGLEVDVAELFRPLRYVGD